MKIRENIKLSKNSHKKGKPIAHKFLTATFPHRKHFQKYPQTSNLTRAHLCLKKGSVLALLYLTESTVRLDLISTRTGETLRKIISTASNRPPGLISAADRFPEPFNLAANKSGNLIAASSLSDRSRPDCPVQRVFVCDVETGKIVCEGCLPPAKIVDSMYILRESVLMVVVGLNPDLYDYKCDILVSPVFPQRRQRGVLDFRRIENVRLTIEKRKNDLDNSAVAILPDDCGFMYQCEEDKTLSICSVSNYNYRHEATSTTSEGRSGKYHCLIA